MKQYFAKYLPVEGEIKKGDYVKCNGAQGIVTDTWGSITVLEKDGEEHNWRSDIPKLHKLFLCSRDIQVGDTNLQHYDPLTNTKCADEPRSINNEEELLYLKDYIEKVERYDCFKVLGEISPEATWVKEGDTFNNDEIKQHIVPVKAGFEKYYDTEHQEEMERDVYEAVVGYYKIKGSCGNFH